MTRVYYILIFGQAMVGISLRFLIRRFLENNPLVRDKPLVKKIVQFFPWFLNILVAVIGFLYLNYVKKVRLEGQRGKCIDAGDIEH